LVFVLDEDTLSLFVNKVKQMLTNSLLYINLT